MISPLPTPLKFNDFLNETDDDWDADIKDNEASEGIFDPQKLKQVRSIEHRPQLPSKLSGRRDDSKAPKYPSPRRGSSGLKPQFEGLVRGGYEDSSVVRSN